MKKNIIAIAIASAIAMGMYFPTAKANRGEVAQIHEACSVSLASSSPDKSWFGLIVSEGCPYDTVATWTSQGECHTPITKGFVTWLNGQDIAKEGFNLFYVTPDGNYRIWMDIPFYKTTEGKARALPPPNIVFTGIEFTLKIGDNAVAVPRDYR